MRRHHRRAANVLLAATGCWRCGNTADIPRRLSKDPRSSTTQVASRAAWRSYRNLARRLCKVIRPLDAFVGPHCCKNQRSLSARRPTERCPPRAIQPGSRAATQMERRIIFYLQCQCGSRGSIIELCDASLPLGTHVRSRFALRKLSGPGGYAGKDELFALLKPACERCGRALAAKLAVLAR
jgi:hypothetical protein